MAKWGEGDPRWIVEEREDAKNPNNWHWVEKDATAWSKSQLKKLLEGLKIDDPNVGYCEIKELTSIEGEATANNRKGKLVFFYELVVKGEYKGQVHGDSKKYSGTFEIPNLSEENSAEEIDVDVSITNDKKDNAVLLKELMRHKGTDSIRERISQYITALRTEYGKDLILPSKNSAADLPSLNANNTQNPKSISNQLNSCTMSDAAKPVLTSNTQKPSIGVKIETATIDMREEFKCSPTELYDALTCIERVRAFTRSDCVLELEKGGRFSLLGGNITGTFTDLTPGERVDMRWRKSSWPAGHHSLASILLVTGDDHTELVLTQTGVPRNDVDNTRDGWARYYWQSIKTTFGYGACF